MLALARIVLALIVQAGEEKYFQVDTAEGLTVVVAVSQDTTAKSGPGIVVSGEGLTLFDNKDDRQKTIAATWMKSSDIRLERKDPETLTTNICGAAVIVFVVARGAGEATGRVVQGVVLKPGESARLSYGTSVYVIRGDGQASRLVMPKLQEPSTGREGIQPPEDNTGWYYDPFHHSLGIKDFTLGFDLMWVPRFKSKIQGTSFLGDGTEVDFNENDYRVIGYGAFAELSLGLIQVRVAFLGSAWDGTANITVNDGRTVTTTNADTIGSLWTAQLDLTHDWAGYEDDLIHFEIKAGARLGWVREDLTTIRTPARTFDVSDREKWTYAGIVVRPKLMVHLADQFELEVAADAFVLTNGAFGMCFEAGLTLRF